jgi:hypothetical protein
MWLRDRRKEKRQLARDAEMAMAMIESLGATLHQFDAHPLVRESRSRFKGGDRYYVCSKCAYTAAHAEVLNLKNAP